MRPVFDPPGPTLLFGHVPVVRPDGEPRQDPVVQAYIEVALVVGMEVVLAPHLGQDSQAEVLLDRTHHIQPPPVLPVTGGRDPDTRRESGDHDPGKQKCSLHVRISTFRFHEHPMARSGAGGALFGSAVCSGLTTSQHQVPRVGIFSKSCHPAGNLLDFSSDRSVGDIRYRPAVGKRPVHLRAERDATE